MAVDSTQYDTARSQSRKTRISRRKLNQIRNHFNLLPRGQGRLELWKKQFENLAWLSLYKGYWKVTWLCAVFTVRNLTPRSMILRWAWFCAVWYCAELRKNLNISAKTKRNLKTFSPIGQWPRPVGMMKKTGGRKSLWTVPLMQCFGFVFNWIWIKKANKPFLFLLIAKFFNRAMSEGPSEKS